MEKSTKNKKKGDANHHNTTVPIKKKTNAKKKA